MNILEQGVTFGSAFIDEGQNGGHMLKTDFSRLQFILLIMVLVLALFNPQAQANAQPNQVITPSASALDIARAIAVDPTWVTGASFVVQPPTLNTANAVSDTPLTSFPIHGATYGVLTTGTAASVGTPDILADTILFGGRIPGRGNSAYDVTILRIDLQVPSPNNCLFLDFQFLSEEYPDYVVDLFNDAFIAELDSSTWFTHDHDQTITAPNNFAFDPDGNVVSIHSTGVALMAPANGVGTAFSGTSSIPPALGKAGAATVLLTASTPITPGSHSLYLSIFDQRDKQLDSAVFLDNLVLRNLPKCIVGLPADVSITKSDSPDPVSPGSPLTYTLTVTNHGPNDATGVTVIDTLPAGVTLVSATPSQGTCTGLSCDLGNLANGASATVTVMVTVDVATPAGTITNTANVSANEDDPDAANNTASTSTQVAISSADLAITKSDSPDPVTPGSNLTYTLTVTNNGPNDAPAVTVTDTLPAGVTLVSATPSAGTCTGLSCDLGNLANGASATINITVTVDPAIACGTTLTNTASVGSSVSDPNAADNTASADTTVTCPADLSISKSDAPDPVMAGDPLTYVLTVANNGPGDASGVSVTDTLPAGVTLVSATPSQGTCTVVTCDLGSLANGASATVTVTVTVDAATPAGTLTNTATVSASETDPDATNNTASADTMITAAPDVCTILDEFNRADGPLGSNWAGRTSGYRIRSNQVAVRRGRAIYWQPEAYGPDQEACVTLTRINPRSRQHALLLKVQELNNWRKGAILVSYNARSGNVDVKARDVAHHRWILVGSFAPPTPVVDGDQLRAKAFADGTVQVFINNTSIGSADAGSFYANKGGQIGLWFRGRQAEDDEDDDHDRSIRSNARDDDDGDDDSPGGRPALLDDFGGGTIATP
jgi:uncharacterized repeat protein (TIGR01451 family)